MVIPLPTDVPTLRGDMLTLRAFEDTDVAAVLEASRDPHVPLITTVPAHADREAALAYVARQRGRRAEGRGFSFAMCDAEHRTVGQVGLWLRDADLGRASIGYWVVASARRRGHAAAALALISRWGLALPGLDRLELYVEPWNEGSWRAAERAGYQREGLLRQWQRVGEKRRDMLVYSLLRDEVNAAASER